jgi:hypothetical protein
VLSNFYGMPVSCHSCGRINLIEKQNAAPAAVAVQERHHLTSCQKCGLRLIAPGKPLEIRCVKFLCPACRHSFAGGRYYHWSKSVLPVTAGMVLAVCGLVVGLYSIGYLPTELRVIIGKILFQIDEASMLIARLFP